MSREDRGIPTTIGIVGATGPAGSGFAARLADAGFEVLVGSRSAERGCEVAGDILARWPDRGLRVRGGDNSMAATAEMVVIATPWTAAGETAGALGSALAGKTVLSMANALVRSGGEFQSLVPPRGSVAAAVQAASPSAHVVAAMHHVPAKDLGDLDRPVGCDVLVCSDHDASAEQCVRVLDRLSGVRALRVGQLTNASAIEAFTAVLLELNHRHRRRAGIRITGLE